MGEHESYSFRSITGMEKEKEPSAINIKRGPTGRKTWLLTEFGKTEFSDTLSINFEQTPGMDAIFGGVIEPDKIIDLLGAFLGRKIIPEQTLLIFDEVQEVPRALTALKYFAEQAPQYPICCARSMPGVTLHKGTSFPVGKVDILSLYPLSFREFLEAHHETELIHYIEHVGLNPFPLAFSNKLLDYLRLYFVIGGMPAVVIIWLQERDFNWVDEKIYAILDTYEQDFSKHASPSLVPKLRYIWNSIPSQLAKENRKFISG
jgi:uncharacterized protein